MMFVVVDASLFRRGGGEEQPKHFLRTGGKQQQDWEFFHLHGSILILD
jgi:hypothetical protein